MKVSAADSGLAVCGWPRAQTMQGQATWGVMHGPCELHHYYGELLTTTVLLCCEFCILHQSTRFAFCSTVLSNHSNRILTNDDVKDQHFSRRVTIHILKKKEMFPPSTTARCRKPKLGYSVRTTRIPGKNSQATKEAYDCIVIQLMYMLTRIYPYCQVTPPKLWMSQLATTKSPPVTTTPSLRAPSPIPDALSTSDVVC